MKYVVEVLKNGCWLVRDVFINRSLADDYCDYLVNDEFFSPDEILVSEVSNEWSEEVIWKNE